LVSKKGWKLLGKGSKLSENIGKSEKVFFLGNKKYQVEQKFWGLNLEVSFSSIDGFIYRSGKTNKYKHQTYIEYGNPGAITKEMREIRRKSGSSVYPRNQSRISS
jgi:hypothetical protein